MKMGLKKLKVRDGLLPSYGVENVHSCSSKVAGSLAHETRLTRENQLWSEKALVALKLSVKIVFLPITLLAYLIYKFCANCASSHGLGNEATARNINFKNRSQLLSWGGQKILFGFKGEPLLEGMFFQADSSNSNSKTILICAGSHLSYEKYTLPMIKAFKSMGHNVMVFNYEGFGNSEGTISEEGIYRSVEAAYQYLKQEKKCEDKNIVGWGYSLGSAAVSDLASKHKVDIVIDRGFSSMSEVAYHKAPWGLKTIAKIIFLVGARFDNLSKLKKSSGRVLIVQGTRDTTMVEEYHGRLLEKAVCNNQYATFRRINSAHGHGDKEVWLGIGEDRAFVEQFLSQVSDIGLS